MLKKINVEEAVGLKLAHDHTQIIPGKFKGVGFRRGHVVQKSDIPKLLDLGKKQVFVLSLKPGELHEEDAARRMARVPPTLSPGLTTLLLWRVASMREPRVLIRPRAA